jgi:ADP-dependent phosphofructokinase/glucokinase
MINTWKKNYSAVPRTLDRLKNLGGVASVFNANIDAIVQVNSDRFHNWHNSLSKPLAQSKDLARKIESPEDVLQGLLNGFKNGIAQEWLVTDKAAFEWLQEKIGYDKLQMGGQGGIISNVMTITGVQKVYVHTASHESRQASLFLDDERLLASNGKELLPAKNIEREGDIPLMHWILEFKKGQTLILNGEEITCPKSNRFIATYDPLNFDLHLDQAFSRALKSKDLALDVVLMSGFHMLGEKLSNGRLGIDQLQSVWQEVKSWKASHPDVMIHLEFASTQNLTIRQAIAEKVAHEVDSIGLNEQELIDILEIIHLKDLACSCRSAMNAPTLFDGTLEVFKHFDPYRCQLHMFGIYLTLTRETDRTKLLAMRDGMALAATLAATKAGTGSLENKDQLLHGHGQDIWGPAVQEMKSLNAHLTQLGVGDEQFLESGIVIMAEYSIVALPTILVEKPVSLVGMGDTISSLSLVGSLV